MNADRPVPRLQEPGSPAEIEQLRQQLAFARQALHSGESRQRMILDSAVDYAIIVLDLDGLVTQWTEGASRILGWTEAEMLGRPASVFFTLDDRQHGVPQAEMSAALHQGRGNDERWHLRKDGSRFWANGEMMPLLDESGTVQGFIKVLRDRTEQRQTAERNRADAEFLRSVLASSGDCIKVLDLDAKLLFMSEGGQRVMEVSDFNAICGCPWPDFWQGKSHLDAKAAIAVAKAGGIGHFQGPADTMAGSPRWWDVQITPIMGADGTPEKLLSVSRDVTEAYEAKERIELALDAGTVVGTWVWDVPNDRITGDRRFARAFSVDPDRLAAGMPLGEIVDAIHPDDLGRVDRLIASAMAQGGRYSAEYRVRQMDDTWRWIEAAGHCDLDASGRAIRFPGALFDIDRRKRHELRQAALLELGETLRALRGTADIAAMAHAGAETLGRTLDASHAGYGRRDAANDTLIVDRDWCAGPAVKSIAGVHRLAEYGTYLNDLRRGETVSIPDIEQEPRTRRGIDRLRALGIRAMLHVPLMQDGQYVASLFVHSPVERIWTDDEIAFARTVADRTWAAKEQGLAEARLRQLNETLEAQVSERTRERDRAWRLSQDLLVIAEADGTIAAVNAAWTELLGWVGGDLIGRRYTEFTHPEDLEATIAAFAGLVVAPLTRPHEYRFRHKDGSYRWFAWTGAFEEAKVYASGRHTTAEHEQAAALRKAEEQLQQSQKMEAVGQLTGGLAHDFNNLLTGIAGSLELLQTRIAQGRLQELDRYITAALGASKRATALTHRLLAFSRRQTLDPSPININRLVAGLEDLISRTVGPAVEIEVAGAPGLWTALVDPNQLENALLNLCINARDAMPDGGRITIRTANERLDQEAAEQRELPPGQYVLLGVADTGTGMAPETIARAFDPFFTTKPIGQGTGLGLSMIYGFTRQSGGQVRIESELGRGTTMCLYLPRHHGPEDDAPEMAAPGAAPRAEQGETVLIVDDEPTVRMLVTEVLEDLGYMAIEAADGASGLQVLQSNARIDLLVTDVGLPGGMNGRQLAEAARLARPELKVLFITGYAENAVVDSVHLAPGMHVLVKPFALDALANRIKDLIAG